MAKRRFRVDERTNIGPLQVFRSGATVYMRNTHTASQHNKMIQRFAKNYPRLCTEIDAIVQTIRAKIATLEPVSLLTRAAWQYWASRSNPKSADRFPRMLSVLEYIQAVIVSTAPLEQHSATDVEFEDLTRSIQTMYDYFFISYPISLAAHKATAANGATNPQEEELLATLLGNWMFVRGERHLPHEAIRLAELLRPHSDVLQQAFGQTSLEIVEGFSQLLTRLEFGPLNAMRGLHSAHKDWIILAEKLAQADKPVAANDVLSHDQALSTRIAVIAEQLTGTALFRVDGEHQFSDSIKQALSLAPGEHGDFFSDGQFSGWPLRHLPTWDRPFIRLNSDYFCFNSYLIRDRFYRSLSRALFRISKGNINKWKDAQATLCETLAVDLLAAKMPPGHKRMQSMYYDDTSGNRCEVDAIIAAERRLIVVEAKAGAFLRTSPILDFDAYQKSIKDLIAEPIEQAARFIRALRHYGTVQLFDPAGIMVDKLSSTDFDSIVAVATTLDSMTHISSQIHLFQAQGSLSDIDYLALSIDDIRVMSDLLRQPFELLHYLDMRSRATKMKMLRISDEQDHLALYLSERFDLWHTDENRTNIHVTPTGFDENIDQYYSQALDGSPPEFPGRTFHPRIVELLENLNRTQTHFRVKTAFRLLDMPSKMLQAIGQHIESSVSTIGHEKPRALHLQTPRTGQLSTIVCFNRHIYPSDRASAKDMCLANLVVRGIQCADLILLRYSAQGFIECVSSEELRLDTADPATKGRALRLGSILKVERWGRARANGERDLGRNDPCPCSSGKKFKRCCMQ